MLVAGYFVLIGALFVGQTHGSCEDDFNAYNAAASAAVGASAGVCKQPEDYSCGEDDVDYSCVKAAYDANNYATCNATCLTGWTELAAKYAKGKLSCDWPDHAGEFPVAYASPVLCLCSADCTPDSGCNWNIASECGKAPSGGGKAPSSGGKTPSGGGKTPSGGGESGGEPRCALGWLVASVVASVVALNYM